MTKEVRKWPNNNAKGERIHEVQGFQMGDTGFSWIKSHQTESLAGPVPIAFAANALADTVADEGAATTRFTCKNDTIAFQPAPAGQVKIAAGGERIVALYRGEGIYGDAGEVLRTLCADALFEYLTRSCKRREQDEGVRFRVMTRRWGPLGSPQEYNKVEVEGEMYDLTEDMFSTWTGQAYCLNESGLDMESSHYNHKCPLCGSGYLKDKYSTSHALMSCKHHRLRQLRTKLLVEADMMLGDISPTIALRRSLYSVHSGAKPEIEPIERPLYNLQHAGDYLIDGDVEAWMGVPLKHLAEWLETSKVDGEKISQDGVKQLLRKVTASIVVKGRHILRTYRDLVTAAVQQQQQDI